ncbi:hypothetical protein [Winogradskya humida]|uniref:Leucine rich repeat (LRR) protein n=1 Tax=Winogradskya humida TaxID=113566 RepID=A0ABQ4A705_9ACTN|nr:hypothetical protein [Actinoplanes humidus]GIE26651.1 hypothetical protein Ahu01nite_097530 [Actinoplanes humidus]
MVNYSLSDTGPLEGLPALSEVKLLAAKPTPPHPEIDLAAFTGPALTTLWVMNAAKVVHIESLKRLPFLREVRLIDCELSPADLRAIASLPDRLARAITG